MHPAASPSSPVTSLVKEDLGSLRVRGSRVLASHTCPPTLLLTVVSRDSGDISVKMPGAPCLKHRPQWASYR